MTEKICGHRHLGWVCIRETDHSGGHYMVNQNDDRANPR